MYPIGHKLKGANSMNNLDINFEERTEKHISSIDLDVIESADGFLVLREPEEEKEVDSELYYTSEEEFLKLNGLEIPLITTPECESGKYIGKYAERHLKYAEEHFFARVDAMSSTGELYDYLYAFNDKCESKLNELIESGISHQEADDIITSEMINTRPISRYERDVQMKKHLKPEYQNS